MTFYRVPRRGGELPVARLARTPSCLYHQCMQYRDFGKLDFRPSALGFGAMRLPVLKDAEGRPEFKRIDYPAATAMLHRAIDGISQKMLTQTLRDLESNGLVLRKVYPEVPPHTEYSLTPLGLTLTEPLDALCVWAERHLGDLEKARQKHALKGRALGA